MPTPRISVAALALGALTLAGCLTVHTAPPQRNAALEARIAQLEAQLLAARQPAPADDDRLNRIEQQLSAIVGRLESPSAPAETPAPAEALEQAPAEAPVSPAPEATPAAAAELLTLPTPDYKHEGWGFFLRREGKSFMKKFGAQGKATVKAGQDNGLIGQPLPQRRFIGPTGEIVDLDDFRGNKRVVLIFLRGFANQVCIYCSAQTAALANAVDEFESRNAQVILVYPGEAASVPAFLDAVRNLEDDFELPFPILLDPNLSAVKRFGIEGDLALPTSLILDRDGVVQFAYVGKRHDDRPSVAALLSELDREEP